MTLSSNPLQAFIGQLELHSDLTAQDLQLLHELPMRLRHVDAATYLVREGAPPLHCDILVEGFAFRQKLTGDGERQIMGICIPGDAIDLQNVFFSVSDHSVQMLGPGIVADVQMDVMQNLVVASPTLGQAVMQITLIESSILREWVVNIGRRDARERIAHLLCEFAVRLESRGLIADGDFELPMTQEQLADATGLTPVHVNRTLKALEAEGLISRHRRHIHSNDWRALQDVADFSRGYLHVPAEETIEMIG